MELVASERAGIIAWKLAHGARLTNRDIQDATGLGASGAWLLMGKLSRVLPLVYSGFMGTWECLNADGFEGNPPLE